jgi:YVTN family beta-propeller protein
MTEAGVAMADERKRVIGRHAGFFSFDPDTRLYCMITLRAPRRDTPGPTGQLVAAMLANQRRELEERSLRVAKRPSRREINTTSNTVTATWPALFGAGGIAISADGTKAYAANQYANTLTVQTVSTGTILCSITGFAYPNAVAIAPNGNAVYVTNGNGESVSVINPAANTITDTIPVGSLPTSVAVSPDGSTVYLTSANSYMLSAISASTNKVTNTIPKIGIFPISVVVQQSKTGGVCGRSAAVPDVGREIARPNVHGSTSLAQRMNQAAGRSKFRVWSLAFLG